jgi:hypothetical protein
MYATPDGNLSPRSAWDHPVVYVPFTVVGVIVGLVLIAVLNFTYSLVFMVVLLTALKWLVAAAKFLGAAFKFLLGALLG